MQRMIFTGLLACLPLSALAQPVEVALIRKTFAWLNPISITEQVEFCGYVGFDANGELAVTNPTRGDEASCLADEPTELEIVLASYHTHGQFSPDYFNEVPSVTDIEGDEDEGIDGWVATPGGRLWFVDTTDMVVSQICGIGCLPSDPNFIPGDMGRIAQSYRYTELVKLLDD